jgi:D-amino-acid dehydrogenase
VRVIVVGGGAVGLCVAESLSSRGAEVVVFERERCGAGASAGNAGWITPSLAIPVPGPGVIGESLRWLVNPSGPLWIRPTVSPEMLEWIARFVLCCAGRVYRRGLVALQAAAALAGPAFDRLAERGVEFELHNEPLLYPAFDQGELDHLLRVADELRSVGLTGGLERISAAELTALEPALAGGGVIAGVIARGDRRVRPERLSAGVQRALVSRGVEVLEHCPVTELVPDGPGWTVGGPTRERHGDAVVLASGVASARLLARLGVRLPIAAAKGYSRTYSAPDSTSPRTALYLENPKVAISAYEGAVRVSGTLELGARGHGLSPRRLEAISGAARRALPAWRVPYIGPVPGVNGLHLATAHGTLGVTLGPLTGELLAPLLLEGTRHDLLRAFDPARVVQRFRPNSGGLR